MFEWRCFLFHFHVFVIQFSFIFFRLYFSATRCCFPHWYLKECHSMERWEFNLISTCFFYSTFSLIQLFHFVEQMREVRRHIHPIFLPIQFFSLTHILLSICLVSPSGSSLTRRRAIDKIDSEGGRGYEGGIGLFYAMAKVVLRCHYGRNPYIFVFFLFHSRDDSHPQNRWNSDPMSRHSLESLVLFNWNFLHLLSHAIFRTLSDWRKTSPWAH